MDDNPNDKKVIDEEAIAEEEFVADLEDTIENPLVYDGEKVTVQEKPKAEIPEEKKEELTGAIGTGDLTPDNEPFNNEEALRSESVNNDENPFGSSDTTSDKNLSGAADAPLEDAAETISPAAPVAEGAATTEETASDANPFMTSDSAAEDATSTTETPAADATPATDAPVVSSEPTVEQIANGEAAAPVVGDAPKKKKTGLIVGIVVAVLLVAAIVGGVIFFVMHESKERVLGDAISGIWSAEATQFDGTVNIAPKGDSAGYKNVAVSFKADEKGANFSGSGNLTVTPEKGDAVDVELSGAYISSDGIYVKIGKLEDMAKKLDLAGLLGAGVEGDDSSEMVANVLDDVLIDVAKDIDGTWFKIDGSTFGSSGEARESYDCFTKALDDLSSKDVKDKIANIYKAHPFIISDDSKEAEKADGLTYYYVKTNEDESKAFANDVKELDVVKDLQTCSASSNTGAIDDESGDAADEEEEKDETKADIKLGIKGWSHELQSLKGSIDSKDASMNLDVKLGYEKKDVSAPTGEATNIADAGEKLIKTAEKSFKENWPKEAKKYCEKTYKTAAEIQQCTSMLNQYGDTMLKELEGQMTSLTSVDLSSLKN